MRVFASTTTLGTFTPKKPNDEQFAKQASQYINHKFWNDWNGYQILWDAFFDALIARNGIIKHWWDESEDCEYSTHSGLNELQLTDLISDEGVEVLTQETKEEGDETLYSVKIKRVIGEKGLQVKVIQPEQFLIDENADSIDEENVSFCGHIDEVTRSTLIQMGFDKDKVYDLSNSNDNTINSDDFARGKDKASKENEDKASELVDLYECYINIDVDDDGVSERVRAYMAGDGENGTLLSWEVWDDDLPFTDLVAMRLPHRFDGRSVADDTMDIQQVKTVLIRQAMDNTYGHNNPQKEVEKGSVLNPEQLTNPKFGGILHKKPGSAPIHPHIVPYTADKSFMALEYFDKMIEKRTGVSRSTMALDPDALQNQTATAVQASKDSSYSKIEVMARNLSEMGLKRLFKMLLRLVVKHQDKEDIIRLNDDFVTMDPRHWNASMDVNIEIGLGTGSRDRDMAMLGQVLQNQMLLIDRLAGGGFASEAVQMLPMVRTTLVKQAESAGIKNPDDFYPEVGEDKIKAMAEKAGEQKQDPKAAMEAQKASQAMQMQQQKMQQDIQISQQKMQQDAQMQQAKMQQEASLQQQKLENELMLKREQMAAEMVLKRDQMMAEIQLKRESMYLQGESDTNMTDIRMGGELG
tara:strand:+ start:8 stop:1918 length:1911 start_codon:yes stop_codon:yes gene_type:complete